jgi:hypothetical protein
MPPPGDGVSLNTIERCGLAIRYLRVSSGPQRGRYVHQLVMEGGSAARCCHSKKSITSTATR